MKARQLLESASFDPQQLKAVCKAFDDAWEQAAPHVPQGADSVEAARMKLANLILGLAKNGALDPQRMTEEALKLMFPDPTEL